MKKTFVSLEQAKKIIEQYPTPFYLYDEKGIRENARKVNEAFSWNKGFREYFAVKATPTPGIIKILKEEGCGSDCSSYTELVMADAVGQKGHDIMFSSNVTPAEDFVLAAKLGAIINFDDITHIPFFEKLAEIPETVCCRYNPGGTSSNDYYPMLAKILFQLAVELKKELDIHISFINLSGGVGIPYEPEEKPCDIMAIGEGVRKAYEEILVPEGMDDVAIYTEMGRYMLAPYGSLLSKAIHEKHIYKEYIGLDACAANLMRPAMYGAYHHITVLGKENAPCDHKYDITGGLCENNDKFAIDRMLPEIEIGDILYIHDTGAHGHAMGYNYNGKLRSAELLLKEDGSVELLRRAETEKDYFAVFDFTGLF